MAVILLASQENISHESALTNQIILTEKEQEMKVKKIVATVVLTMLILAAVFSSAFADEPANGKNSRKVFGQVFFPNPVAYLNDYTLTDQDDAAYEALEAAYVKVELTNLDSSGYLHGDWAYIYKSVGPLAYETDNKFIYDRHDDRFEQVMAYYWVTEAQKYIQSLGFGTGTYRPINKEPQDIRINQLGQDNSYSWDKFDMLRFGKGGVDDAEDAEVILHEYGHAMMDSQSEPFGNWGLSHESGAIGEGFADYWAVTVSDVIAPTDADPACVADWDATSYASGPIYCLRRVDLDLHYPTDMTTSIHHDGQIWSRALWDIRQKLGHGVADTLILEAIFDFTADTSFEAAALVTVETAKDLYGHETADKVIQAFTERGILNDS